MSLSQDYLCPNTSKYSTVVSNQSNVILRALVLRYKRRRMCPTNKKQSQNAKVLLKDPIMYKYLGLKSWKLYTSI